jgi:ribosomal protein S27AE
MTNDSFNDKDEKHSDDSSDNSNDNQQTESGNMEQEEKDTKKIEICPNCGEANPESNFFCSKCGYQLVDKRTCPRCGEEVPVFNSFCSYCGAPMKPDSKRPERIRQQPTQERSQYGMQRDYNANYANQQQQRVHDYRYQQQRSTSGSSILPKILGGFFIFGGVIGGLLLLIMFLPQSIEIVKQTLQEMGELETSLYGYYGTLVVIIGLPSALLLTVGTALIFYQPENNSWKGAYYTLRYFFLGTSVFLGLIAVISILGWSFYYEDSTVSGKLGFWLFAIIPITIENVSLRILWIINVVVFSVCVGLLITPTIIKFVKQKQKDKEEMTEVSQTIEESSKELDQKGLTFEEEKEQVLEQLLTEETKFQFFRSHNIKFRAVEEKKGRLSDIFYTLKSSPLVKSIELLCFSFLISIIVIFFLGPIIEMPTTPVEESEPLISMFELGLAGVLEEISFRGIIMGIPMIVVVGVRYWLQQNPSNSMGDRDDQEPKGLYYQKRENLDKKEKKLFVWDIPLAIRGQTKHFGIPEGVLIVISALFFGFAHWEGWTGSWGAWKIFQTFVMGLFLGYAFVKYGLASSIFIHFSNNVLIGLALMASELNIHWIDVLANFSYITVIAIGVMKAISILINGILWIQIRQQKKYEQQL